MLTVVAPPARLLRRVADSSRTWSRYGLVVVVVLGSTLSLTGAAYIDRVREEHEAEAAAERVGIVQRRLERRLVGAVDTLQAIRPLWVIDRVPTDDDFHRLVEAGVAEGQGDTTTYDRLSSVGFVRALAPGETAGFLAARRAERPAAFAADLDDSTPHYVIDHHAPAGSPLVGTDLYPLPDRRQALERARDEGRAVATGWIHPATSSGEGGAHHRLVSVVVVPVYTSRQVPPTLTARRGLHVGWLATPLSAEALLQELAQGLAVGVDLRASDSDAPLASVGETRDGPAHRVELRALDRAWLVDVRVPPDVLSDPALAIISPVAVAALGLLLTTLVALLLQSQYAAKDRVERRAAQATRDLRRSEESLRLLAARVPVGILDLDGDLQVTWANTRVRELLGLPADAPTEEVGSRLVDDVHPDDHEAWRTAWQSAVADGQPLTLRHRVRSPDGREGWVDVAASPVHDEHGRAIRWLVSLSDVTRMMRSRQRMEDARDAAIENAHVKSAFLANMSHEIRTPLNGVIGMAGLLLDSDLDARQRERVVTLRSSAEELLVLLNDILDLSRIESGRLELESVPFSPVATLEGIVRQHASTAFDKGLELRLELDDDLPGAVLGDPVRVRQVLQNLVANAVKFTQSGRVVVTLAADTTEVEARLVFGVADTGPGIPAEARGRIFEAFTQADATTTRRYGGTGLGLSICRQLADLMHGDVLVDSVVGVGSRFTFTVALPVTDAAPVPDLPDALGRAAIDAPGHQPAGMHVLLAEDNEVNQRVALGLLAQLGVTVDVVEDGRDAVDTARAHTYDAILMDCQMPRVDGYEATRRLRAASVRTPVIAMTAAAMTGDRERCLAAGMDDYLSKPVRLDELRGALARWAVPVVTATPDPGPPLLDDEMVAQLLAVPGLLADVRDRYLESSAAGLQELDREVRDADWEAAVRTAHRLKGSSASMGAARLAQLLARVEAACTDATADATELLAEAEALLADTGEALQAVESVG